MAKINNFEELEIFQMARTMCKEIYTLTGSQPWKYDTRFVQQIHAAAGSIMDNIAEGFERDGNKELVNFLYIAKGSCGEVRSQIIRAHDVGFLTDEKYDELYSLVIKINKGLFSFIRSVKSSDITGLKNLKPETRNPKP